MCARGKNREWMAGATLQGTARLAISDTLQCENTPHTCRHIGRISWQAHWKDIMADTLEGYRA